MAHLADVAARLRAKYGAEGEGEGVSRAIGEVSHIRFRNANTPRVWASLGVEQAAGAGAGGATAKVRHLPGRQPAKAECNPVGAKDREISGQTAGWRVSNGTEHSVIDLVNTVLRQGIERRASDIHFEPTDQHLLVRFRLDGLLHDVESLPRQLADNVVARLKVMAGLLTYRIDIPQEGSLSAASLGVSDAASASDGSALDLRVATFPTVRGERAVVRVLYSTAGVDDLESLGFSPGVVNRLQDAAGQPSGLIVVTGPAGAGKSTTLYCLARHILKTSPGRSVVSLEDPVEQRVEGMTQIQISPHGELNYERSLRSLLRQDAQVLLVGEARDAHTAGVIVEASLTGHLILTTMHSGDPAEAVVRLLEMGIPSYQLVSTLSLVCSQRLLRTLCSNCRRKTGRTDEPFVHVGCRECYDSGYRGRTACGQVFVMDGEARSAVLSHAAASAIREIAVGQGPNLLGDAARVVQDGRTDRTEIERVLGARP